MYMGSADVEKYDQVLESVMIGPFNTAGNYRFIFQVIRPILLHWPSILCLRGCQNPLIIRVRCYDNLFPFVVKVYE